MSARLPVPPRCCFQVRSIPRRTVIMIITRITSISYSIRITNIIVISSTASCSVSCSRASALLRIRIPSYINHYVFLLCNGRPAHYSIRITITMSPAAGPAHAAPPSLSRMRQAPRCRRSRRRQASSMYIYIYIYTHTHTHTYMIYIYICVHTYIAI